MSARAIYTFKDAYNTVHVYKHHDGYPSGASEFLQAAGKLAWQAPRFEADEFAASFVAANKDSAGGVRLTGAKKPEEFAADTAYLYQVTGPDAVTAYHTDGHGKRAGKFYSGTFAGLAKAEAE